MKLTPKQQAFADMYVTTGNATESYMKVYKCKNVKTAEANSSRTLRNDKVRQYVAQLKEDIKQETIWTIEKLVQEFAVNHTMARDMKDVRGSNDSMKEIGKLLGHYEEKIRHSGEVNTNNPLKDLTAAELKKLIDK